MRRSLQLHGVGGWMIAPCRPARHRMLAMLVAILAAAPLAAQDFPQYGDELYRPRLRQPGKDVMWLPTPDAMVTRMLRAAKTTSEDVVYDLGAGDGKIPIAAARDPPRRRRLRPCEAVVASKQRSADHRRSAAQNRRIQRATEEARHAAEKSTAAIRLPSAVRGVAQKLLLDVRARQ